MESINKSYNALKSTAGVISEFQSEMEDFVLNTDEALTKSPAGFINLHMSTLGKLSAYSFFEQQMIKKEINTSTALKLKSLLRHLSSSDISSIYGDASALTFILAYPEDEIKKNAIANSVTGDSRLRLNKDFTMKVSDDYPTFTLDHSIDIIVTKYIINGTVNSNIYAKYDTSDNYGDGLSIISNPFITSRSGVIINGIKYFVMYITMRQYMRTYNVYELNGSNNDQEIVFEDELMGFQILYKAPEASNYSLITAYPSGEDNANGPNYSIDTETNKKINIEFSKIPGYFSPTTGSLKVIIYTTKGTDGNFTLPLIDENVEGLDATFAQDRSNVYEEAIINIVPVASLKNDTAIGGKNMLTLEEVRALVVEKDSGDSVITPGQIETKSNALGFTAYKIRHDVESFEYRVSGFVKDGDGVILPTGLVSFNFNYSDIPIITSINARMISPKYIFRNISGTEYNYIPSGVDAYSDYIEKYDNGTENDMVSPFFMKLGASSDLTVGVYDLSIDKTAVAELEFINNIILDKVSVLETDFLRNPLDTSTRIKNNKIVCNGDSYIITFDVNTSDAIITHLKNIASYELPYVKFRISIHNKTDTSVFVADIDPANFTYNSDNSITCKCYLDTDNAVSSGNKIDITGNSLTKLPYTTIPYQFYFIDPTVDVKINVIFLSSETTRPVTEYDDILTEVDIANKYYVGIVYKMSDITFLSDMSDYVSVYPSIKLTQPTYKYAEDNIPDTYNNVIYETNDDGSYKTTPTTITNLDGTSSTIKVPIVLHNKGDTKQEYDGRLGSYDFLNSIWSNESLNTGIVNDGSIMGKGNILASVEYEDLIIYAGYNGRVACYDTLSKTFYNYNTVTTSRSNSKVVIKSDGTPMGNVNIRGLLIINDILIAYGDSGRIVSCDLNTNKWRNYDSVNGNTVAYLYNNGVAMGSANIYSALCYDKYIVFAGGLGRIACYNTELGTWIPYNTTSTIDSITNDGTAMGNEPIYSIQLYSQSILIASGGKGRVASYTISTKTWAKYNSGSGIRNNGAAMNENSIYASIVYKGILIVAGQNGYIASYDILKNNWIDYNTYGLCSNGNYIGNVDIFAISFYDTAVLFGGREGRLISYNTYTALWTKYNGNGICNKGEFILNSISCITIHDSIMYVGGRDGNIVYKYRKGEMILDINGKPIVKTNSQYIGSLKGIPAYNRIYAVKNKYTEIIESYNNLIDSIKALMSAFTDGCSLSLGVKRTTIGTSSVYKYKSISSGNEVYINSNALSFSLGVKFTDNTLTNDVNYLMTQIKTSILNYVKSFTGDTFSIYKMLDTIKKSYPNIEYFEIYKINKYATNECQTIYKDANTTTNTSNYTPVEEALTIKYIVDETNSNIDEGVITMIPDITLAQITV